MCFNIALLTFAYITIDIMLLLYYWYEKYSKSKLLLIQLPIILYFIDVFPNIGPRIFYIVDGDV